MRENSAYMENPFKIEGVVEISYTPKVNENIVIDPESGEMYTMRKLPKNYQNQKHDPLTYTKYFQGTCNRIMELPTPSLKMFIYAMDRLKPLQETVFLHSDDCMVVCGFKSVTSYREGIRGLIDQKIIARKIGSNMEYWINPNVLFNGNRLRNL